MIEKTVYLAGPIAGLTHDEARFGWRVRFAALMPTYIHCASPMRAKEFLKGLGPLTSVENDYPPNPMSTAAGITTRDYNDVRTADAMVACYLDSGGRPSLGTAAEYGYAWSHQIPVIAVGPEDDPNITHFMLSHMSGYRVDTIEEAAMIARHLLTPGL